MKPTDKERREVAARLRESRSFVDGLGRCGMTQNALDTFERILECVGYETGDVFDFLADLIEPAPERRDHRMRFCCESCEKRFRKHADRYEGRKKTCSGHVTRLRREHDENRREAGL